MEKIKICKIVEYEFNWNNVTLAQVENDLLELKKLCAERIVVDIDHRDNIYFEAHMLELETDNEYISRIKDTEMIRKAQEQREYNEYQRLKAKFEI
jgi:hypothetical protein